MKGVVGGSERNRLDRETDREREKEGEVEDSKEIERCEDLFDKREVRFHLGESEGRMRRDRESIKTNK